MPRPTVILQWRRKGDSRWVDSTPAFFAVFEHERDLAEERVKELNTDYDRHKRHEEWRVKP